MNHQRAGAPRDRRANRGVLKLHLSVLDGGAVRPYHGVERGRGRARCITLLARADTAFDEVFHSLCNDFGVCRLCLIALQVGLGLIERGFQRPVIQREKHLPGLDIIALLEIDRFEFSGNLRPDRHCGERLDRANDSHFERHVLLDDPGDRDRNGRLRRRAARPARIAG